VEEAEQNRSEQATPFKLKKAREKGTVARSADLGFLAALLGFLGYLWISGPALKGQVLQASERAFVAAPNVVGSQHEILHVTGVLLASVFRPLAFLCATVFLVVLILELAQTGLVFSTDPLKPDFSRLSPAKGFKRVFSLRTLTATGKSLVKLVVYVALSYLLIRSALTVDGPAAADATGLVRTMGATTFRLLLYFAGAAALFAAIDQMLVRRDFSKQMRMSRREVRRESRDREGEPRIKQRRKQLHGEFVKISQSLRNLRGADVLVTNPTHFAVALKYDAATMAAPMVVSQGAHQFAQRLKGLAFSYGVPIVEDRLLARALYRGCQLDQIVPDAYYAPVAKLYLTLRERKSPTPKAPMS
jgi:flagellar biosynthetic protein FlhB